MTMSMNTGTVTTLDSFLHKLTVHLLNLEKELASYIVGDRERGGCAIF